MALSGQEALTAFVAELTHLRALCGSPSLADLVTLSADLPHPLARSTVSDKLNARSLPDWDFVVSFVSACRAHAEKAGSPPPPGAVGLDRWDQLHLRLLRDLDEVRRDDRLATAARTAMDARGAAPAPPMPRQLPPAVHDFVGRAEQLLQLSHLADEATREPSAVVVAAIHGTAGVGKTALAVRAAHMLADRFPGGQLYVNLRGFEPTGTPTPPSTVVRGFLEALSVPPERVPASLDAQVSLYRSLLAGRRTLVLLDNAQDSQQVRPLLPGAGSLVLVTSRDHLVGLVAREGARSVPVNPLTDEEARHLLASRIGRDRVQAEPDAVGEVIQRCACLPLALSIVAARAAVRGPFPLVAVASELRAVPGSLDALDTADPATGVRPTLSWSYQRLSDDAATCFRLLALHPGPDAPPAAVASLAGMDLRRASACLAELAGAHLVEEQRPNRFGFHDLLRAYASELLASTPDRRAALHRLLDHYLHTAHRAALWLGTYRPPPNLDPAEPGVIVGQLVSRDAALAWFAAEHGTMLALVDLAAAEGFDRHAWQLARTLVHYLFQQGRWYDLLRSQQTGLSAAQRLSDQHGMAVMQRGLSLALTRLNDLDAAARHGRAALALFREAGDLVEWASAHLRLSNNALCVADRADGDARRASHWRRAARHAERAVELFQAAGDRRGEARALSTVGWTRAKLSDHRDAIAVCRLALTLLDEVGDLDGQAATWDTIAYARRQLGEHAEAVDAYHHAMHLYTGLGNRYSEAETLTSLGDLHLDAGEVETTRDVWGQALAILNELDHPGAGTLRTRLAALAAR